MMTTSLILAALRRTSLLRRFIREDKALAAIEFAFIAPLMIATWVGAVAVTNGVTTDRKVTLVARSTGDIVAQDNNVTAAELQDVFDAGRAIMAPYSASTTVLRVRVSDVKINATGKACVRWSASANGGFKRAAGSDVTTVIPKDLLIANTYLIMPEIEYDYTPLVGDKMGYKMMTLTDKLFMRARTTAEVTMDGQNTGLCPG